jgi:bifunctional UDP-N-acetylglucosamine pyrophosphorylase/glucosamine-1-phosphate N-acetyltransferase
MNEPVTAVILAAGEGKRMQSDLAKVLHPLAGRPLLDHVLVACEDAGVARAVVVVGSRREQVIAWLAARPKGAMEVRHAIQAEQHGTGHALRCAFPVIDEGGAPARLAVLCGDAPLLRARTVRELFDLHAAKHAAATILTADLEDANGYGRVIRDASGAVEKIVEHKDATDAERAVREINSADYVFNTEEVRSALADITAENSQQEYYLTDTIAILKARGRTVIACKADDPREVLGVNTVDQLAEAEVALAEMQAREGRSV